jgi:hypothetical protein
VFKCMCVASVYHPMVPIMAVIWPTSGNFWQLYDTTERYY